MIKLGKSFYNEEYGNTFFIPPLVRETMRMRIGEYARDYARRYVSANVLWNYIQFIEDGLKDEL
jgi:hypothetical protein